MNDIPGINLLPAQYQGAATLAIMVGPYLTRAYHAVINGGGIIGIFRAIFWGTNTPKN
jgi:hypothetical protein